jgi:hypothetical protein
MIINTVEAMTKTPGRSMFTPASPEIGRAHV